MVADRRPTEELPDHGHGTDAYAGVDLRLAVTAALAKLSRRQVGQLLRNAVPEPPSGIDYERVVKLGRRRRNASRGAVVLAAAVGVPALFDTRQREHQVLTAPQVPAPTQDWPRISSASRIELLSWLDVEGKGPRTVTDQEQVRDLLAALNSLRPLTEQPTQCRTINSMATYVLTVRDADGNGDRAYLIRMGDLCLQVNGPEGGAAELSPTLTAELAKAFDLSGR